MMNKDFLKDILADRKKLLTMKEVDFINVPKYDELSVKNIWPMIQNDPEVLAYFPSKLPKNRLPDREYTFNVLNTKQGDYVKMIIAHAQKLRNDTTDTQKAAEFIQVSDKWQQQLEAIPFVSSKSAHC